MFCRVVAFLKAEISGNGGRNHYQQDAHTYQDNDLLLGFNLHGFAQRGICYLFFTLAYNTTLLLVCGGGVVANYVYAL